MTGSQELKPLKMRENATEDEGELQMTNKERVYFKVGVGDVLGRREDRFGSENVEEGIPISGHNSLRTARKGRLPKRATWAAAPLGQNWVSEHKEDAHSVGDGYKEVR